MTTDLQEIMRERARQTQASRIDLGRVVQAGDRRRRHRSYVGAGLASAAVVAVGVLATQLVGADNPGPSRAIAPAGAFEKRAPSYAIGSTIHYGSESFDVSPHVPHAYVQTDEGFVFTEQDGVVRLATGSEVEKIGNGVTGGEYLRADDTGSHVAWIDSDEAIPELVVYDTAAGEEVVRTSEGFRQGQGHWRDDGDPAFVFAVDGGFAYVRDAEGLSTFSVDTGARQLLAPGVGAFDVADVAAGLIAHDPPGYDDPERAGGGGGPNLTMVLSEGYSLRGAPIPMQSGKLAPDARYVVTDYNDSEEIFEVATGKDVTPSLPAYDFVFVSGWVSEDTAVIAGLDAKSQADLLECEIVSGRCTVAAEDIGTGGDFQVPIGEHIGG